MGQTFRADPFHEKAICFLAEFEVLRVPDRFMDLKLKRTIFMRDEIKHSLKEILASFRKKIRPHFLINPDLIYKQIQASFFRYPGLIFF